MSAIDELKEIYGTGFRYDALTERQHLVLLAAAPLSRDRMDPHQVWIQSLQPGERPAVHVFDVLYGDDYDHVARNLPRYEQVAGVKAREEGEQHVLDLGDAVVKVTFERRVA